MAGGSGSDAVGLACARCAKHAHLQCPKCVQLKLPREAASFWFIKTPDQIERMRETCLIAREVLDAAARIIQPGITTDEIDVVVHEATIAAGGYPSPLNYNFFPKSCCTSVNEIICHGIPDARFMTSGKVIFPGTQLLSSEFNVGSLDDMVFIMHNDSDRSSVYYKGVHADLNETFFVGNVDEASKRLVQHTIECLDNAIAAVKPGVRFQEIGDIISRHASMSGFSVARSYCGHGIGELFQCAPNIPHYASILKIKALTGAGNKAVGVMKAGQTFTIERMIYSGVWRDRMWPDGWANVTADGKRSAQFEHTLLVTDIQELRF
ncbi:hypothetical protein SASPL_109106 [Salvia splendens]|uniref:Peptidase M24 domain-containing protein n=1 Tax=Salvia splendens TaxID=180675 RepID=A0A8X8YEA3_SALSN|nr:hypothetical protein SASPL_109106 [Salvia splendens]